MYPKRILVVDDDQIDRESVTRLLRNMLPDVEIMEQHAADLVIHSIREFQPDLIIMDIFLTHTTGFNILKIARNLGIMTPAIFVTGLNDDYSELVKRIVPKNNVLAICSKPVEPDTLLRAIQRNTSFCDSREIV